MWLFSSYPLISELNFDRLDNGKYQLGELEALMFLTNMSFVRNILEIIVFPTSSTPLCDMIHQHVEKLLGMCCCWIANFRGKSGQLTSFVRTLFLFQKYVQRLYFFFSKDTLEISAGISINLFSCGQTKDPVFIDVIESLLFIYNYVN